MALTAALFAALICERGVPALRQDWSWFSNTQALLPSLAYATSIWDPSGLGGLNPLVTAYPFYVWGEILAHAAGPLISFVLVVLAIAAYAGICAMRLSVALNGRALSAAAVIAMALLLFNPWTYTEFVAGHLIMVISYLGLTALACEFVNREPSRLAVVFGALAAGLQLQMLIFATPAVAFLSWRLRTWKPAALWVLLAIPEAITVVAGLAQLQRTPFTIPWEYAQAVTIAQAFTLTGYFAGYTAAFSGIFSAAAWLLTATALYGVAAGRNTRRALVVASAALFGIAWASAPHTVLAAVFDAVYGTFTPLGVFRELYDVLVLAVIGIVVFAVRAALLNRWIAAVCAVPAVAFAVFWIAHPPAQYWVGRGALPAVQVHAPANSRFLLLPAIQPLAYRKMGLGMDPDRVAHEQNVTPLNVFYAGYPAQPAIAAYLKSGSVTGIAALSTSTVISRAGYETDLSTLRGQLGGVTPRFALTGSPRQPRTFTPELTILSGASPCSICSRFGSGNELVSDMDTPGVWAKPVPAGRGFADVRKGWTDANLVFISRPALAQPFGGAATSNPQAVLHARTRGRNVLVYVDGRLIDGRGRTLDTPQRSYAWIPLPPQSRALHCEGFCVVAATGDVPSDVPANPPPHSYDAVAFGMPVPWLALAQLDATHGVLRYNASFNRYWFAFAGGRALRHVRLDGSVNGWVLDGPIHGQLVLVQGAAALAALVEVLAIVLSAAIVLSEVRSAVRAVPERSRATAKMDLDAAR